MKNRPKPGTRSYAATGGDIIRKSNSLKDGHIEEPAAQPENPLAIKVELTETELLEAKADLDKAIAENANLAQKITVLKKEAKGQAELLAEAKTKKYIKGTDIIDLTQNDQE